jgi:hypothetical protein
VSDCVVSAESPIVALTLPALLQPGELTVRSREHTAVRVLTELDLVGKRHLLGSGRLTDGLAQAPLGPGLGFELLEVA